MTAVSSRTIDKTFYIFCTPRKSYLRSFSKFHCRGLFDGCGLLIFVHFFFLPSIQISWWEVTFEDLSIKRQTYFAFFREKQFAIFFKTAFGYKSRNRKIQSMKEKKCFSKINFSYLVPKLRFPLMSAKLFLMVTPSKLGPKSSWKLGVFKWADISWSAEMLRKQSIIFPCSLVKSVGIEQLNLRPNCTA